MAEKHMTADEAQFAYVYQQKHRFVDLLAGAATITPTPGRKIIIQSVLFRTDATMTNGTLTFASTGVDSVVYRGVAAATQIQIQAFPYFAAALNEPITVTLAGNSGGTYGEVHVGYLEI